jgi:hypothetical protein
MRDPKLWLDLFVAGWLIWYGVMMETQNKRSAMLFNWLPIAMGFLMAMSHARTIF